jgi:hypothetical protein
MNHLFRRFQQSGGSLSEHAHEAISTLMLTGSVPSAIVTLAIPHLQRLLGRTPPYPTEQRKSQ